LLRSGAATVKRVTGIREAFFDVHWQGKMEFRKAHGV